MPGTIVALKSSGRSAVGLGLVGGQYLHDGVTHAMDLLP
jgi:hypothetical protein